MLQRDAGDKVGGGRYLRAFGDGDLGRAASVPVGLLGPATRVLGTEVELQERLEDGPSRGREFVLKDALVNWGELPPSLSARQPHERMYRVLLPPQDQGAEEEESCRQEECEPESDLGSTS